MLYLFVIVTRQRLNVDELTGKQYSCKRLVVVVTEIKKRLGWITSEQEEILSYRREGNLDLAIASGILALSLPLFVALPAEWADKITLPVTLLSSLGFGVLGLIAEAKAGVFG